MNYSINVARLDPRPQFMKARKYKHFFATSKETCHSLHRVAEIYQKLKQAFPFPEYNITVVNWTTSGVEVSTKELVTALEDAL